MSRTIEPAASKRHSRVIDAKLAVKRAASHIERYPASTATPVVRDLKLALAGLLEEVEPR